MLYFDFTGRAETTRVLLHAAGIPFTDTRFPGSDWKDKIKPTTPLGAVPVLKIDGVQHCQSLALARYAAKQAKFYPEDPLQALVVDEVAESLNELMSLAPKSSDQEELKKLRTEYQNTVMKQYADFVEGLIQKFGSGKVVVGSDVTLADLLVSGTVDAISSGFWDYIDIKFFDAYPGILASADAAKQNEKVKAYYASRTSS